MLNDFSETVLNGVTLARPGALAVKKDLPHRRQGTRVTRGVVYNLSRPHSSFNIQYSIFDILYLCALMTKLIIYGILLYLLYKFVFELVIPVSKATTQVKDKIKEMQEQQMKQQQQQQAQAAQAQAQQAKQPEVKGGDYIEFEEVK